MYRYLVVDDRQELMTDIVMLLVIKLSASNGTDLERQDPAHCHQVRSMAPQLQNDLFFKKMNFIALNFANYKMPPIIPSCNNLRWTYVILVAVKLVFQKY